jgi:hypothetical protein
MDSSQRREKLLGKEVYMQIIPLYILKLVVVQLIYFLLE